MNRIQRLGPWPVLFYIYGGRLMSGVANADFNGIIYSNATEQMNEGLVVVEVAYRVNLFGFLAASSLTNTSNTNSSGNYGFQDQLFALQWVQDNIHLFNGDPNRVILAGQSSGGTSIFALLSSAKSKGLFAGVYSMSGSPNISMSLTQAEIQNDPIITASNCTVNNPNNDTKIVECLRLLSAQEIYELIPYSWNTPTKWGLPSGLTGQEYTGLAIVDGYVIKDSFASALQTGLIDIPIIFGHMAFEPDEDPNLYVYNDNITAWQGLVK
jgi:carboxylesterase type B